MTFNLDQPLQDYSVVCGIFSHHTSAVHLSVPVFGGHTLTSQNSHHGTHFTVSQDGLGPQHQNVICVKKNVTSPSLNAEVLLEYTRRLFQERHSKCSVLFRDKSTLCAYGNE